MPTWASFLTTRVRVVVSSIGAEQWSTLPDQHGAVELLPCFYHLLPLSLSQKNNEGSPCHALAFSFTQVEWTVGVA
jgi:hypothetical protein